MLSLKGESSGMTGRRRAKSGVLAGAFLGPLLLGLHVAPVHAGEAEEPETAALESVTSADEHTSCTASDTVMCLVDSDNDEQGDRFRVTVELGTKEQIEAGEGTPARVVKGGARYIGTTESGLFYFFNPTNWEVLLKVLPACTSDLGNSVWVLAASASDQAMRITVTDTQLADDDSKISRRVWDFPALDPSERTQVERPGAPGEYYLTGHPALVATNGGENAHPFPDSCPATAAG